jgi:hypothetical protein
VSRDFVHPFAEFRVADMKIIWVTFGWFDGGVTGDLENTL